MTSLNGVRKWQPRPQGFSLKKWVQFFFKGNALGTRLRKWRLTAKEISIADCEVLDEKYRIAVQGIFVGNRLVVCLRFL